MNNIEKLTQLTVELEGLLHVLWHRDSENVRKLLTGKYNELTAEFNVLLRELESNPLNTDKEISAFENVYHLLSEDAVKLQEGEDGEVEDEMTASVDAVEKSAEHDVDDYAVEENIDSEESETDFKVDEEPETEDVESRDDLGHERDDIDVEPRYVEPEITSELNVDEMLSRKGAADLKRAFTLNDKFRFRRALFNQDDKGFAEALERLSELSTFGEARDYVSNRYGWDMKNPDVEDFMSIIKLHYPV